MHICVSCASVLQRKEIGCLQYPGSFCVKTQSKRFQFNKNAEEQYKRTEAYKMDLLLEQLDQQEMIIAELTYDNMMMKEDSVAVLSLGEPSYKYTMIKRWFEKGLWDENMVNNDNPKIGDIVLVGNALYNTEAVLEALSKLVSGTFKRSSVK